MPETKQKAEDKDEGRPPERRRGVCRFGLAPEVYVTDISRERVRGFEPRLAVEAEDAHGWLALGRGRARWGCFSSSLSVIGCFCRLSLWPVPTPAPCSASGSKFLCQESCAVGICAGDLGEP